MHISRPLSVVGTLLLLFVFTVSAALAAEPLRLTLGTATKGGGFQLFGEHFAAALQQADPGLHLQERATRGSRENLPLLESGDIDVGLVEGNAARQALEGIGRPAADLKVLSVMYPNPGMFVVRGDSDYRNIDDLRSQPIAFGTQASGLRILVNDVLDGLGLSPEQDFQQIILDKAGDGPRMVLNGEAEALWGAGIGWPGFEQVAAGPKGARFIAPTPEQRQAIVRKRPHLKPMTVPAGTYRGQTEAVESLGLWSLILVRPDLPEATVMRLAAAIQGASDQLSQRLPQGRYTSLANTLQNVPEERLHPGVAKYCQTANCTQ